MSPNVKTELTMGWPNSDLAATSRSRCIGCGLCVRVEIRTLSVSVTVRVTACATRSPTCHSSKYLPDMGCAVGHASAACQPRGDAFAAQPGLEVAHSNAFDGFVRRIRPDNGR